MASTTTRRPRPGRFLPPRAGRRRAVPADAAARAARRGARRPRRPRLRRLFLRLWALQVLSGTKYVEQARSNSAPRTVPIAGAARPDPRPQRERRSSSNAPATAVELWPADLPKNYIDRYAELRALARVTRVPLYEIAAAIKVRQGDPVTPVVVRAAARDSMVNYLAEHAAQFPGVDARARLRPPLPVPGARRAAARLRRRDLRAAAEDAREEGLPARRRDRPGRRRVVVRHAISAASPARARIERRLARAPAQRARS